MLKEKKFTHVQASERENTSIFKAQNKSDKQLKNQEEVPQQYQENLKEE